MRTLEKNFVVIENRQTWLEDIRSDLVPNTPKWIDYWRQQRKQCIEGVWRKDFGKWRYMPGPLYFYIHYCTLVNFDKVQRVNRKMRPSLRDIEWERGYILSCCKGFSGFKGDNEFTCHTDMKLYEEGNLEEGRIHFSCYKEDGSLKKYVDPYEYIRKLFSKDMGTPYYFNDAKNNLELGSRGGGKSYWLALAIFKYNLIFDGKKYYSRERTISENFIASSSSSRSGETIKKMTASINEMMSSNEMGAYSKPGRKDFVPHPFYKSFSGSTSENNGKNPYRHYYRIRDTKGGWEEYEGSRLVHGVITSENPETSAGTRNDATGVEEVGLVHNIMAFHGSNNATQIREGIKFGFSWYAGTAGNVKKIRETSEIFTTPDDWDMISFDDIYENTGKRICFFLPSYYVNPRFKDEHGNTDVKSAKKYYEDKRERLKNNPKALMAEKMNFPLVPSEMWVTEAFNAFPLMEAEARQNEIAGLKKGFGVDLFWKTETEVDMVVNSKEVVPFPYRKEYDPESTVFIYELPIKVPTREEDPVTGEMRVVKKTPKDAYVIGLDPYATDTEKDHRNSFGAAYVMLNPKYIEYAKTDNLIAASYIARTAGGRDIFLGNLEKLICLYGNPVRGLWYENDRGDHVRDYFIKKQKKFLLAIDTASISPKSKSISYGYKIGSRMKKLDRIDKLADFLKRWFTINGERRMAVSCISDPHLLQEIRVFDIDSDTNFDRIMGLIGCVIGINNIYNELRNELKNGKKKSDRLSFFKNNKILNGNNYKTPPHRRSKKIQILPGG